MIYKRNRKINENTARLIVKINKPHREKKKIKYTFRFSYKSMIHCYESEETTEWEETLSVILNKDLKQRTSNPINKWTNELNRHSQKK